MNYIYINKADENWIVDRFIQEWCSYNSDYVTDNIEDADIVWIIAPWNLSSISTKILNFIHWYSANPRTKIIDTPFSISLLFNLLT